MSTFLRLGRPATGRHLTAHVAKVTDALDPAATARLADLEVEADERTLARPDGLVPCVRTEPVVARIRRRNHNAERLPAPHRYALEKRHERVLRPPFGARARLHERRGQLRRAVELNPGF